MNKDILERLADLHHQATTEHCHYYTSCVVKDAMIEIIMLRQIVAFNVVEACNFKFCPMCGAPIIPILS